MYSPTLGIAVCGLALAATLALFHKVYSTRCLGCQIALLRLFKRLDSEDQSTTKNLAIMPLIATERARHGTMHTISQVFLFGSTVCFIVGVVATAAAFARVLFEL